MTSRDSHLAALFVLVFLGAFGFLGKRQLERQRAFERENPYSYLARKFGQMPTREWCDNNVAPQRTYATAVVDRFRDELQGLWKGRGSGGQPKFSLLDLGVIQLRVNPRGKTGVGFDSSSWSWDDAYGLIRKIQADLSSSDNADRWRDVDSMVKFLLEKDYARIYLGRKFLSPELTQHQFHPNPGVIRTGPKEFTVELIPGLFRGYEAPLRTLLESEWSGHGYSVKIRWVKSGAYLLLGHRDSNRSFVNHRRRTMEIAHLAWTKTVAHELGHILGFDDHYYNVWNGRNCYYSQESRLGDLMSNSEHGAVTERHWEILDQAYPWKASPRKEPFTYAYGK